MNALTICQPYATLIVGGAGVAEEDLKRVENRGRPFSYRGPLLIHAGKSRRWLDTWDGPMPRRMAYGAIVGIAELVDCLDLESIAHISLLKHKHWLRTHRHTEGPYCLVLENVRRLIEPIPCNGRQGIWVPGPQLRAEVARVLKADLWVPAHARTCRECGCTERFACAGGCYWVEADLCSECAAEPTVALDTIRGQRLRREWHPLGP